MKEIKIVLVLTIIALLSGLLLSGVYQSTLPKIIENKQKEIEEAVFVVVPDAYSYKKINVKGQDVFVVKTKEGQEIGKAFVASGAGFQDKIIIMVGIDPDIKTITGIKIMDQKETPGLGAKIADLFFTDKFKNLNIVSEIEVIKGKKDKDNQVVAITSATISSKAVAGIINENIKKLRESLNENER